MRKSLEGRGPHAVRLGFPPLGIYIYTHIYIYIYILISYLIITLYFAETRTTVPLLSIKEYIYYYIIGFKCSAKTMLAWTTRIGIIQLFL